MHGIDSFLGLVINLLRKNNERKWKELQFMSGVSQERCIS